MSILCSVFADVLHIVGILLICKFYLQLREKTDDKYGYLKILIVSVIVSLIINGIENQTITLIIYLFCIGIILRILYIENNKRIVICTIWVSIIVELIEMIAILLVNTIGAVINYSNSSLENILVAVLSLGFIGGVGILLSKITDEGIRNISTKYLILFTVNLFANFCILVLMTRVTLEERAYNNRIAYIVICISVTLGLCIEMASVMLLLISRNRYKEKELIIAQYLEKQVTYPELFTTVS